MSENNIEEKKRKIVDFENLIISTPQKMSYPKTNEYFSQISKQLFNNYLLYINENVSVRIVEIEFYYNDVLYHNDPFAHKHDIQLKKAQFYFHQYKKMHSYKGGTYKGLDITFGNEKENIYGGILLRSFQTENGKIIVGPCKCVNYILEKCKVENVKELVVSKLNNELKIFDSGNFFMKFKKKKEVKPLQLKCFQWEEDILMIKSSRIGLTLKNEKEKEDRIKYIVKPYRFLIQTKMINKGKINTICYLFKKYSKNYHEIMKVLKIKNNTINNYYKEYEKGRIVQKIDEFVGISLDNQHLCQLHGYLLNK